MFLNVFRAELVILFKLLQSFVPSFICVQENDFLKDALMIPWTLSTSQQPQQQIPDVPDCNDLKYWDMVRTFFT